MILLNDRVSSIICFLIGLAFFSGSSRLASGADLFPKSTAILMMLLSAAMFVRSFIGKSETPAIDRSPVWPLVKAISLTVAFVICVTLIGFITSSLLFIPTACYLLGYRKHRAIALGTMISVALFYVLFIRIFRTPLPDDLLLNLVGGA